jgi:ATP-dependent Clp protease ATP-binding subunit ClpA
VGAGSARGSVGASVAGEVLAQRNRRGGLDTTQNAGVVDWAPRFEPVSRPGAARRHEHPFTGSEHILLGVCQETRGLGAKVIDASGVSLTDLRSAVTAGLAPGTKRIRGHIPFSEEGKKTLEVAARQRLLLDNDRIGTEHLLLALTAQGYVAATQVLEAVGITRERAQAQVRRLVKE